MDGLLRHTDHRTSPNYFLKTQSVVLTVNVTFKKEMFLN